MPKSASPVRPTAAQVRAFYADKPERVAKFSERAAHTLSSRGQLAEAVIADYNKGRKAERQYVRGNSGAAKGLKAAQRASLAEQGIAVGKRGPLSKVALAALKG